MRLLVIEDDPLLRETLKAGLSKEGYELDLVSDGAEACRQALSATHDVILLDLTLPILSGLEVLRQIRAAHLPTPVLIMTAKDGTDNKVEGLDLGADDYVVKPFAMPELLARIRALLRRRPRTSLPGVNLGDLTIDFSGHSVFRGGRDVPLTPREFAMLAYLANRPSIIVNRDELGAHLYDEGNDPISNAVDVLVGRLRRKLQVKGRPDPIQTRRGLGYQLVPVEPKESSK